jgi:hypothetical protein
VLRISTRDGDDRISISDTARSLLDIQVDLGAGQS